MLNSGLGGRIFLPHEWIEPMRDLIESAMQSKHDFCGDQAAWHCPRLARAMVFFMAVNPGAALTAMEQAKTPYGDPLVLEDDK